MHCTCIASALLILPLLMHAQEEPLSKDSFICVLPVMQMPQYPGGEAAIRQYLKDVEYPDEAKKANISGMVYVRFTVDENGYVTEVKLQKGVNKLLDDAAIQHIQNMRGWTPGTQNGIPVRTTYTVPMRFSLE